MIVTGWQEDDAFAALAADRIETRLTFSVKPVSTVYNFVRDAAEITVNDVVYNAVPYAEFSDIASSDGQSADTMEITLDGQNIISNDESWPVDSVLQSILGNDLRDRPMAVSLAVLNPDTHVVIGLIPQFIGIIDNVPLNRPKGSPSALTVKCSSYRTYSQRRVRRVHSNSDHQSRFPGDEAAKWISSIVFRSGQFPWNKTNASSSNTFTSPPYQPFDDRGRTFEF